MPSGTEIKVAEEPDRGIGSLAAECQANELKKTTHQLSLTPFSFFLVLFAVRVYLSCYALALMQIIFPKLLGSLWIPDWSKRTTVGSTMTDDGTGSLFSTITASYTTPLWLAEKENLRKIS